LEKQVVSARNGAALIALDWAWSHLSGQRFGPERSNEYVKKQAMSAQDE
jgi:hypothetical protein